METGHCLSIAGIANTATSVLSLEKSQATRGETVYLEPLAVVLSVT